MATPAAPHIVVIMTDQQRWDSVGAAGAGWPPTPNIDRLAAEGIDFRHCYCAAPSCVPSRASFYTCRYPHETGVFHNGDRWTPSWVESFREAGYHTANIGKMHTVPMDQPAGFDQRYIVENKDRPLNFRNPHGVFLDEWDKHLNNLGVPKPSRARYRDAHPEYETALGAYEWELDEAFHSDVFVATMVDWFLDQRKADSPLFLHIGFPGPHPPFDPPRRWVEMHEAAGIPVPVLHEHEYARQPSAHRRYRKEMIEGNHDAVRWHEMPDAQALKRLRQFYAGSVGLIDAQIGRVWDALDRNGYLDNCIVLFTSDHGDCLGDHGHIQKWTMYDQITRVPAYLWSRGRFERPARVDALVQQMDLVPLLFDLAGVPFIVPSKCRSAAPALTRNEPVREHVFAEHGPCNMLPDIERMTMIRSREWKLVEYRNEPDGELYDLVRDPGELENLWGDPVYRSVRESLIEHLRRWEAGA